ncbi:alginate export family protein [Novosphingobium sp. KACC 22771]|uniref:alginate export family protein n=1 Tax=Novosphingobium sp. KACC 22771 TaxID=3025670 RepID=UPI0023658A57|nr:alginate export family protein [Novosphingobium sp. KACC 22771]WDF71381.1 alginate export family protein [Novosphingobium sp. KACC 22771]
MTSFSRRPGGGAALLLALFSGAAAHAQVIGPPDRVSQALAAPLSEAYPADGAGDGITSAGYNQSRWVEDWSKLRDPAKRRSAIDHLKFIPVDAAGSIYLTLSGELRLRVNETTNPDLKDAQAQRQDIARIVGGADLHIGPHLRVYGELAHAGISGRNIGTPSGFLDNTAIVQQSFADVTAKVAGVKLGVRYGRQTFSDGPNLLLVPRDNNTIFLSYNGIRGWAKARNVRIDMFDFTPTRPGQQGTGDDLNKDTRRFSGISGGLRIPNDWLGGSKLYFDPFYWRLRNTAAVWGPTTANEVREFYGLHLWGDAGPVNLDWTVNYQGGHYDNRQIAAWQVLMAQSYRLGRKHSAPRVGIHADYATGGGAYGTGKLKTALAPLGNNIYYSYQLYATPTNLIAIAPNVSFQPASSLRVSLEYQFSWRETVHDAVYRANGTAFAGTQNAAGRKIAETARAQAVWTLSPHLSVTGRYEHLHAGPALTNAGFKSSDFFAGWISFRF